MRRALLVALALLSGCSAASVPSTRSTPPPTGHAAHPPKPPPIATGPARPHPLQVRAAPLLRLPTGVSRAVAVADSANVLVLGGLAPGDSTTGRAWLLDVADRTTKTAGALAAPVHDACGAVLGGHAFVFGGGASTTTSAVQEWQDGSSRVVSHLPQPRSDSSCALLNGTAYIAGGFDGHRMVTAVLATSDGVHFRVVAHLRQGVRYAAVAAVGHWLVVAGGALATTEGTSTGAQSDLIQRVDVDSGRVDVTGHLPAPIAHATAVTLSGHVLVVGGRHGTTATADIATIFPVWPTTYVRTAGRLPHALSDAAIAVVGDTAFVVGGESSGPAAPVSTVTALRLVS